MGKKKTKKKRKSLLEVLLNLLLHIIEFILIFFEKNQKILQLFCIFPRPKEKGIRM